MQWTKIKNHLHKEFIFADTSQIEVFLAEIKKLAQAVSHDPDKIVRSGQTLEFFLMTHSAGNIVTEKDWSLAKALDTLYYSLAGSVKTYLLNDPNANKIWEHLYNQQVPNLQNKIHPLFWQGLTSLGLSASGIPDLDKINSVLKTNSDFEMERTQIQYAGDKEWFTFLKQRRIMVTNYIRTEKDFDYTPLPDIFHDIVGHLPWLIHKPIANLAQKFGQTYVASETELQRFMTERLWWNAMEFGLMLVDGQRLIIGAGLTSSFGECNYAFDSNTKYTVFQEKLLPKFDRSPHVYHKEFAVFESFDQISKALDWILANPQG